MAAVDDGEVTRLERTAEAVNVEIENVSPATSESSLFLGFYKFHRYAPGEHEKNREELELYYSSRFSPPNEVCQMLISLNLVLAFCNLIVI